MEPELFEAMQHRIREMKSSIELFLATGMAKNFDDYCRMIGEYSALGKVEQELKDLEQKYIES